MIGQCQQCGRQAGVLHLKAGLCPQCRGESPEKRLRKPADKPQQRRFHATRVASISFKVLSYLSFIAAFTLILERSGASPGLIGYMIILPATIILLPALLFGPVLALFIWHDRYLNRMKALTLALLCLFPLGGLLGNDLAMLLFTPALFAYGLAGWKMSA